MKMFCMTDPFDIDIGLKVMCHIRAESVSHMHQLYTDSDEDESWYMQTHLKVTFRYWPVASLIDYYHNELLSLSAFVGWSDQLLDIV